MRILGIDPLFNYSPPLKDRSTLLRAWRRWHAEQLQEALEDVHADVLRRLTAELKNLHCARTLVNFIGAQDWSAIDADTRAIALHEIGEAITELRQRNGLIPFDDGLRGDRLNVFQIIRGILTGYKS